MKFHHLVQGACLMSALVVSGCSAPVAPTVQNTEQVLAGSSEVTVDRFTVRFATDPAEPAAGKFKFVVYVMAQGKPVDNATVKVQPEMPGSDVDVAEMTLTSKGKGRYEGEADLRLKGAWQARVSVSDGSNVSNARFTFKVR